MTANSEAEETLLALANELAADVSELTDEEIRAEFEREGTNPEKEAKKVRLVIEKAIKQKKEEANG